MMSNALFGEKRSGRTFHRVTTRLTGHQGDPPSTAARFHCNGQPVRHEERGMVDNENEVHDFSKTNGRFTPSRELIQPHRTRCILDAAHAARQPKKSTSLGHRSSGQLPTGSATAPHDHGRWLTDRSEGHTAPTNA
jgi:hypothetical protein